jgi:DUF1680 family protein
MADYYEARIAKLSPETLENMTRTDYKGNPVNEYGGFAESLLALNRITGNARYLKLAQVFMRDWFINPLAAGEDKLAGMHANTHIPQVTTFAQAAMMTGDERLHRAADNFWHEVTQQHSFAFGGNAFDEKFKSPGTEAADLTDLSGETCNTYNMLKLTRALFETRPDCSYADYFELALYNHILASVAPDTGLTTYHVSVKPGHFKVYGDHDNSLWCCTGTGIENSARYGEGIYFTGKKSLWVNLYIPSTVQLPQFGLKLTQESKFPADDRIYFKINCKTNVSLALNFRLPNWLASPAQAKVNGKPVAASEIPAAGHYLELNELWHDGDTIEIKLPMALCVRPAMDDTNLVSFFYGPVLLAGELGRQAMPASDVATSAGAFHNRAVPAVPKLSSRLPTAWTQLADEPLHFIAPAGEIDFTNSVSFIPFFKLHHERYSIYWLAESH